MAEVVALDERIEAGPFGAPSERMRRFREASRQRGQNSPASTRQRDFLAAFFERYAGLPYPERYARSMAYALENAPVYLLPDERLVGILYQTTPPTPEDESPHAAAWAAYNAHEHIRRRQAEEGIEPYLRVGGAPGHVGWRWERLLEVGIAGHMEDLRRRLATAPDEKARQLYAHALLLWEAVLRWNDRHVAALCQAVADADDPDERARLEELIAICSRAPRHPARTFREALQSFHFQHLAVMFENPHGGFCPGRMDLYLGPYLERDLASGKITLEETRELIEELFIRFHERLEHGDMWVEAVMVGGRAADGACSVNALSYLMLEAISALDITHPSIYARLGADSPESFLDLTVHYLLQGKNRAQVFNDDALIPALQRRGMPLADASQYMAGGCMEVSAQGANCDLNFAHIYNLPKTLELFLTGGIDLLTGERRLALDRDLTAYDSFEALYAVFEAELVREHREIVRGLDVASACYAAYRPCYLFSSLTLDCLERGREQQDGGARYHDYGYAPLGITSAADALAAIKAAVYDQALVSPQELLEALRANYAGHESLRARLARLPKFGAENREADAMCARVLGSVCAAAAATPTRYGGRLKPMIFNFVWTPGASAVLGAQADGSLAGDLIGHGMTPRGCAMTEGITAAMNSCLSLPFVEVTGGATTMWDMDENWISFDLMKALLSRFLRGGGMIFQGNTTSVREMEEAYEHPERYPNLIVRVGGFSARFVTLDRAVQREIIGRYRHRG